MPEGTVVAAMVFEPSSVRERGRGGRAEVVIPDRGVMEVEDDTPPRAVVAERAGADGGGGGVVLEQTLWAAASEAPPVLEEAQRAAVPEVTPAAGPEMATQGIPASGSGSATQGVPEEVLAASRAASEEHALVPRQGERRAAVPQPVRSGGAVVFGPQTQEEAALDAVSRCLRGRTERLEAFAQAEVERTRDLERAILHLDAFRVAAYNRLLGKHRELMERLATKEEELRVAAAEVLSWRTRLLWAGHHYDRLIADTGRLGVEAAHARAEAAAARRSLDEANRLHEQLAGHKSRLEAEACRREAAEKAAEDKDAKLKAALAKAADLEKALEEQHLEEPFSSVHYQRDPTGVVGSGTDPRVAWTFLEIIAAAEARLQVLGTQLGRLSQAGTAMTAALWPDSVQPSSFSRLARWSEMGPDRLGEWRVSAARAGAEMALWFTLSWHPDLQLDALMGQQAGSEQLLQEQAGRIASRASYIAEFAFHDDFHPEQTEDGGAVDGDDYGLLLHEPEGSSEETGVYHDADAEEGTGTSLNPEAARGEPSMSRRGAGDA
nr:uncharacterized protein LOC120975646 [Aegilops tauschii subsp. strangulata]